MSKSAGRFTEIYYAGYDLTGYSNQVDVSVEFAEDDVTAFGDGAENSIPDMPEGTAEVMVFLDPDTDKSHDALKTPGSYTDQVFMTLFGSNAMPVIGDRGFAMLCKEFRYAPTMALRSAVLAGGKFLSAGKLDINGYVLADTTITATTSFSSVNNGAPSANGLAAYLQILTPVATDSYVIKVQHSTNNLTWVDLITFAANGQSRTSERLEVAGTVNQYLRALATRTGSAAESLKLAVLAARH